MSELAPNKQLGLVFCTHVSMIFFVLLVRTAEKNILFGLFFPKTHEDCLVLLAPAGDTLNVVIVSFSAV